MKAIGGIMLVAVALLGIGSAQADIPKGAPVTAPPPIPMAPPPALSKPAPPLPPTPKVRAKPAESPGTWINPDDYPAVALRHEMTGITAFRLFLDPSGKPTYCQITAGSGFDVLDNAACERLIEHGKFQPARDSKGRAAADVWTSRVVWRLPYADPRPLNEGTGIASLTITKLGVVTGCIIKMKLPGSEGEGQCWDTDSTPRRIALEMRGYGDAPEAEVDLEFSIVLSAAGRDRLLANKPGYETRSLLIYRFEIDPAGKMTECRMERQKGSAELIDNFCFYSDRQQYKPFHDASGTPVSMPGWTVYRVLRKLGP